MSTRISKFVADSTEKTAQDLVKIVHDLPEDKRYWKPLEKGRSAADQFAECALLNGYTATLIQTHQWPSNGFEEYAQAKNALVSDWENIRTTFDANLTLLLEAIRAVPEEKFSTPIEMPWGTRTLGEIISYPLWNMSYHEGQINYILSLLAD